ncbi:MAG: ferrous iron transport protein B [Sulfolobales archaeon]
MNRYKASNTTTSTSTEPYIEVGVVGSANVGKSTLFNILTGGSSKVSNWPGTTVEMKRGDVSYDGAHYIFVDLPGISGYKAYSIEEKISRRYLLRGGYNVIISVGDLTSLERSLYVSMAIAEMTSRTIIAINKIDLFPEDLSRSFVEYLREKIGVPVVGISALKKIGVETLLKEISEMGKISCENSKSFYIDYGELNRYIEDIERVLEDSKESRERRDCRINLRGLAIGFLAEDPEVEDYIREFFGEEILKKIREIRERARREVDQDLDLRIINSRYSFIERIVRDSPLKEYISQEIYKRSFIDRMIEKPGGGLLLLVGFLLTLFLVVFTINTGFPLTIILSALGLEKVASIIESYSITGLMSLLFSSISESIKENLAFLPKPLVSLLADGVIPGVGAVLSFIPVIFLVSIGFAMLEDSGVATRIALGLHRGFSRLGFSGRFVYPLIVSLGCNVPGVMLSRTAMDSRERIVQILSIPFIPCQARLIVAIIFSQAIFPGKPFEQALLLLLLYVIGVGLTLLSGYILSRTIVRESYSPELVIELPPLHRPYLRVVGWISWSYTREFIVKAGFIIFLLSIFIWFLSSFGPQGLASEFSESYAFSIGSIIQPLLSIYGINSSVGPIIGFTLIQGFVAKEGLVSSLAILMGYEDPVEAVSHLGLTTLQMISMLVFMMLYVPCMATLSMIYQETRSIKWTLFSIAYMMIIAFIVSLSVFLLLELVSSA